MFWLVFFEWNFRTQLKAGHAGCPVRKSGVRYEFYCEGYDKNQPAKNPQPTAAGQGKSSV